jgi:hypothetical protein
MTRADGKKSQREPDLRALVGADGIIESAEIPLKLGETAFSCGDSKGDFPENARSLRLQCRDCEELLHQLANILTGVLMNAQVLEWKLPPYSHLKRSVRELERNAQRSSEMLKRLTRRLAGNDAGGAEERAFPPGR